jgi:DNA replication protein DnaC
MGYSAEVIRRAKTRLDMAREDHNSRNMARQEEVYKKLPRIREIDRLLRQNMVKAAYAAFSEGAKDAMEEAKEQNKQLQTEREQLLKAHFSEEYWEEKPFCGHCGGSGWLGSAMCDCLKKLCMEEQRRELGAIFSGAESFDTFRLDYYSASVSPTLGVAPRTVMEKALRTCREYARSFGEASPNLLLIGGTGLGKTHLALSVGRVVGEMGCSVCYESAASLFSVLEQAKFNPSEESLRRAKSLETCDLLIIDDLGTEMPGQFVTAALYSILNIRLMNRKPMLITTNFSVEEAGKRYSPQIASRLYGEFVRLTFVGEDIRVLRNRGF